jgi:hypothetical protein|tara:strand:+ start:5084 stop:5263 length:180 start_codon:yes stop_codon:yes gene_type:complete
MSSQTRLESLKLAILRGLDEAGTLLVAAAYDDYIEMGMSQQKKAAMEQKIRRDKQKEDK